MVHQEHKQENLCGLLWYHVLMSCDFVALGQTVNAEYSCDILKRANMLETHLFLIRNN